MKRARQLSVSVFVLAGASNVLIDDSGVNGLVIKPDIKSFEILGPKVRVGVGISMNQLLNDSMAENLSGLEWSAVFQERLAEQFTVMCAFGGK